MLFSKKLQCLFRKKITNADSILEPNIKSGVEVQTTTIQWAICHANYSNRLRVWRWVAFERKGIIRSPFLLNIAQNEFWTYFLYLEYFVKTNETHFKVFNSNVLVQRNYSILIFRTSKPINHHLYFVVYFVSRTLTFDKSLILKFKTVLWLISIH